MKPSAITKYLVKLILGIGLLSYIIYRVGAEEIIKGFTLVRPGYAILSLLFLLIVLMLGSLNTFILIRTLGHRVRFRKLWGYSMLSWAYGLFLPGKVGEFAVIYYLKKEGVGYGIGTVVAIIDKLITIIILGIVAMIGLTKFIGISMALKIGLILLAGITSFWLIFITEKGRKLIRKLFLRKYEKKFKGFSKSFFHLLKRKKEILILNFIITILKWILTAVIFQALFYSMGITPDFILLFLIMCTVKLIALMPVSINGLGVSEAFSVYFYGFIGIAAPAVMVVSLIIRIINYSLAFIMIMVKDLIIGKNPREAFK